MEWLIDTPLFEQTARVPRLHISRYTLDALRQYQETWGTSASIGNLLLRRRAWLGRPQSGLPEDRRRKPGDHSWTRTAFGCKGTRTRAQQSKAKVSKTCWFGGAQICGQSKSFDQEPPGPRRSSIRVELASPSALEPRRRTENDVTVGGVASGARGPEETGKIRRRPSPLHTPSTSPASLMRLRMATSSPGRSRGRSVSVLLRHGRAGGRSSRGDV